MLPAHDERADNDVPRLDARIRVERFVAEGGFGRVYRGHHRTLDRDVAIKVLKVPEEYGDVARAMFCERFAQEARIIARLDHPAVVRVLDFGVAEVPGGEVAPYMILDWLDGVTLKELIAQRHREGRAFEREETLQLLSPVIEAVALAHAQGIVHRDITPGNLMLVDTPTGPALRLLDFGIAKVMEDGRAAEAEDTQTHTALLAFSPRWAAPEQAARGRTGPWTDVHALGLLCTAMLTARRPYQGSREALFQEIFSETRPTPGALGVDAGAWEPVLARALALRPEERPSDAGALLRELQDAVFLSAPTRVVTVPASVRAAVLSSQPQAVAPRVNPARYAVLGALATLALVAAALFATRRRDRPPPPAEAAPVAPAAPPQDAQVRIDPPVAQRLVIHDASPEAPVARAPRTRPRASRRPPSAPVAAHRRAEVSPRGAAPAETSRARSIAPVRDYR